ncbi:MAG: trypsin-like peptidase domain-containing protein [Candidatus Pacebacteria bacterium]|nr:trypsin-like peptidase domain-containing protein [Candidatus Paceibacterota bacterium]
MQEIDIIKFIKKHFAHTDFLKVFLFSFFFFLVFVLVGAGVLWHYRAKVFGFLGKEYMQEIQNENASSVGSPTTPAFSQDSFVIGAVKKTNPAVVSVIISENVPKYDEYTDPNQQTNPFGDLFPGFSFNVPEYKQDGTQNEEVGGGSGFLISSDGLIVTNKHVVDQTGATYTVFTNDGKKYAAKIVAKDPVLDIALIKITPPIGVRFPYLTLGNSDSLQLGQSVIAIGNALGEYKNSVSVGVVSGLSRSITAGDESSGTSEVLDHVIQTDAAINPGNSGGPLLDLSGEVIGVNVAVAEGSQSVGFALPINSVKSAILSVENTGKIIRPYLGVRYVQIDAAMQQANNLSVAYGALIKAGDNADELAVIPGSPADKAGLVENDIILDVNGVKLDDTNSLSDVIRGDTVGQVITLTILHKGVQKTVSVTLEAAPDTTS